MATKKKHRHKRGVMGRSDVPYVDRLRIQKGLDIGDGREQAAALTMWSFCLALHRAEGIGYKRLVRFAQRFRELDDEWYDEPELAMARARRRLGTMGIQISGEIYRHMPEGMKGREAEIYGHKLEAAQAALICGSVAANDVFGFGGRKLERICQEFQEINRMSSREIVQELVKIGFQTENGRLIAHLDENGNAVRIKEGAKHE